MAAYTTYCDPGFLDQFYRERPARDVLDFTDDDHLWISVHEYLRKETNVVVSSASRDPLVEYPFLRYLLDRPAGTRCVLAEAVKPELEESSPWTLYMTKGDEVPPSVWRLTPGDWRDCWSRLGDHCLLDVCSDLGERDRLNSWEDLQRFRGALSSIVICDRYMLSSLEKAKENVFELIVSLLPREPAQHTVDVTLVTLEVKEANLQKVWDALHQHLLECRPEQTINLTIVKATNLSDYHDRHVFVDYGFMISGHSFNYFKQGQLAVTTTLTYEPAVKRSKLEIMVNRLRELGAIVQKTPKKIGLYHNVIGNRRNRLLNAAAAQG